MLAITKVLSRAVFLGSWVKKRMEQKRKREKGGKVKKKEKNETKKICGKLQLRHFIRHTLEKWSPLRGERAHSLKLFCMYNKRFEISKTNRMEEETEPQT